MSLVVSQTLPYSSSDLKLEDPKRWSHMFPLMRPSVKVVEASNGQAIVLDMALANSKNTLVAAIVNVGSFPGKILSESHIAAFTIGSWRKPLSSEDLSNALRDSGFPVENGVVVVETAAKPHIRTFSGCLEVAVKGEAVLDHVLSLLSASNIQTKASFDETHALMKHFLKFATTTNSTFHEKKTGAGPSVAHAVEVAEFGSAKRAIDRDLQHLLSSNTSIAASIVYSIHYSDINGLSRLENNILAHEISGYLANSNIPSHITQSTILDSKVQSRGWAISMCPIPTDFLSPQTPPTNILASTSFSTSTSKAPSLTPKLQFSDSRVRKMITAGCSSVIKDEPTITEYDTIVGDGDCGYTLRDGAKQVLQFINDADLSALPSTLSGLVDDLEVTMGGTSGALYCIFLSSLAQELWNAETFPEALKGALEHLLKYTRARLGDRTCLDCLIPFVETMMRSGDSVEALRDAEKGVESTKQLEAKLGRSSYLDEAATRGVPDPGAYGLLKLLEGMVGAK